MNPLPNAVNNGRIPIASSKNKRDTNKRGNSMRIYYAHPIPLYGTASEVAELELIMRAFPGAKIVNSKNHQPTGSNNRIKHFKSLVKGCDCLIFSKFM
ncbi:MAG: hypothetical protein ACP5NE_02175 [Candidatus Micrarchaeia archaeon]